MREFTDQELIRREKANKLKELGIDPFGNKFERTAWSKDIKDKYIDIPHDDFESINDEFKSIIKLFIISFFFSFLSV